MALYDVTYVHQTDSAILVKDADDVEIWLPLSKIDYDGDLDIVRPGQLMMIEVPDWLALEKGLS